MKIPITKKIALEVYRQYRNVQAKLHELDYLFWECTLRCNLKCLHCGSDCQQKALSQDMPLKDFLGVLDQIKTEYEPKKIIIVLTGGEPLMRADIEECGREFTARGFPWGTVTNGYNLTPERFERCCDNGLRAITVSLDGLEESHSWLRGDKLSYKKALNAIFLCVKKDYLSFDVVTCVNQKNFSQLKELKKLLIDSGVKKWRLFTIFPKGRAKDNGLLDIDAKQFSWLLEFIKETRAEGKIKASFSCEGFLGPYEADVRNGFFYCRAGINVGSVLIDGSISACPSLRADYIQGNIYKDRFLDVWNNRFQIMRDRRWTKTGECEDCKVFRWCNGNGLHLRDEKTGELLRCHYNMLREKGKVGSCL